MIHGTFSSSDRNTINGKNATARASFGEPFHNPQNHVSFGETIDMYPFSILAFIGF